MQRFLLTTFAGIAAGAVIFTASLGSEIAQAETTAVAAIMNGADDAVPMRDCPCGCERNGPDYCYYVCAEVKQNKCVKWTKKCESTCAQCIYCGNGK